VEETFEPHFTFQGFRYVACRGSQGNWTLDRLTGVVIYSDMPQTAGGKVRIRCSTTSAQHCLGTKGNFLDVPTDCPQRTGAPRGPETPKRSYAPRAFNMDVAGFFTKWLRDLAAAKGQRGRAGRRS